MAPWVTTGWRVARRARALAHREWQLLAWAALPLIFYSVSIGKQPRYVLPILPPLAILLARSIHWRIASTDDRGRQRTLAWCATSAALALLVFGALLHRAKPLLFSTSPSTGTMATSVILLAGLGLLGLAWMRRPARLPLGIATASVATLLSVHYSIYSAAGIEPVQKMAAVFRDHWPGAAASGTYRVFVRNLVFYTGVKQSDLNDLDELRQFLSRPERVLAVAREEDLDRLRAVHGLVPFRLERVTYFNPAGVRLRTLLSPDPENDLETVWLVSNR
jgi:4-amino-4-deoxy-L-arabinose transferase-like glycosyltransferase